MQQPPSDRSNKNPYAMPSAWPRAPEQTFHLKVPKAPPGTQPAARQVAPKPAAPTPPPAEPSGSAFPAGYFSPQAAPKTALSGAEPPARAPQPTLKPPPPTTPVVESIAPKPVVDATPEAEPEVAPAPPFIAPPQPAFAAPRRKKRQESRAPLFIAGGVAALAAIAGGAWLLLREPEATVEYETVTSAPVAQQPVVTPPAFLGLAEEPAEEPALRGAAEPVETAAVTRRPATRAATPQPTLPSGPQAYSGDATPPAPSVAVQPLRLPPLPAPPPPASAPGPQTPVADPDAPQTTRDPTTGD